LASLLVAVNAGFILLGYAGELLYLMGRLLSFFLNFLLCFLLISGPLYAAADDSASTPDAGASSEVQEGETIWLEEKIKPSTRWLEGLVKPMTTWMEKRVQDKIHGTGPKESPVIQTAPSTVEVLPSSGDLMDEAAIARLAQALIPGQVLRVKLLQKQPLQYRVKLISNSGEIHKLYLNARSGEPIPLIKRHREP